MQLYNFEGRRLYVIKTERHASQQATAPTPCEVRFFCGVLQATCCQISETLR